MTRQRPGLQTDADGPLAAEPGASRSRFEPGGRAAISHRLAGARTREEAEERYVAARDTWVKAMRAANSGRPADLASLAIAQEAYEAAVEERERWISGVTVAIPIEPPSENRELEAAVRNELAWRVVLDTPKPEGFLGRIRRLFRKSGE